MTKLRLAAIIVLKAKANPVPIRRTQTCGILVGESLRVGPNVHQQGPSNIETWQNPHRPAVSP